MSKTENIATNSCPTAECGMEYPITAIESINCPNHNSICCKYCKQVSECDKKCVHANNEQCKYKIYIN